MSKAIRFNLDQSENVSFGNGLIFPLPRVLICTSLQFCQVVRFLSLKAREKKKSIVTNRTNAFSLSPFQTMFLKAFFDKVVETTGLRW